MCALGVNKGWAGLQQCVGGLGQGVPQGGGLDRRKRQVRPLQPPQERYSVAGRHLADPSGTKLIKPYP